MNKDNAHLYLPLVQALAEGKTIRFNHGDSERPNWIDKTNLVFRYPPEKYHIKPEPRVPREWTIRAAPAMGFPVAQSGPNPEPNEIIRVREIIEEP